MFRIFRIEINRALTGKGMLLALLIGLIICMHHWAYTTFVVDPNNAFDAMVEYQKASMSQPDNLWGGWIGGDPFLFQGFLLFLIIPILAAMPFGNSYLRDVKDGFVKNVFTRTERKHYYVSKWLATFISGGLVVVIPLAINFLLMFATNPIMGPYPETFHSSILDASLLSNLYFSVPFLYVTVYFFLIFAFAGVYATLCLVVTLISDYSFIVVLLPFLCILFVTTLLDLFGLSYLSPQVFLFPGSGSGNLLAIVIELALLILLTFAIFVRNGVRGNDF